MQLTIRDYVDNDGKLIYLSTGIRVTEKDLKSILYHDIQFLQAVYDTSDRESIFTFFLNHLVNLDKIRLVNKSLTLLSKRLDFKVTSDYYDSCLSKFLEDRQLNILYINWVNSNYDKWKKPTLDHIVPLYKGGTNEPDNLQWLTYVENQMKGCWMPEEWDLIKANITEYFV